jgi:hypothetical protein
MPLSFQQRRRHKIIFPKCDPDFCDLVIEDSGLGMDESTRQELLKETVLLSKKKRRYCTGLGLQLCKSMIKKNGGNSGLRANGKGTKMIVSLPKTQKMDNVNVLIIEDTPLKAMPCQKLQPIAIIWLVLRALSTKRWLFYANKVDVVIIDIFLNGSPDGMLLPRRSM